MSNPRKQAVVLLSGGLDSATCLAIAQSTGFTCRALTIDYGQRHRVEISCAKRLAKHFKAAPHLVLELDLRPIGGSALTADIPVPKARSEAEMNQSVPRTYVPARNTIFLSLALGWAETLGCSDIFIGVNALDYSGYPDCRPEFIESFERTAALGTCMGAEDGRKVTIHTPLIGLSKAQIIKKGLGLGLDYGLTHSCYDPGPDGRPCGACDSCLLRKKGFAQAGAVDPLPYPE